MAHSTRGAEAALRAYLLADAREFRQRMTETLLDDGPVSAQYAWTELSKPVDQLAAGKACMISRYQLPHGHPLSPPAGHPCDCLLLGADDVLRLAE